MMMVMMKMMAMMTTLVYISLAKQQAVATQILKGNAVTALFSASQSENAASTKYLEESTIRKKPNSILGSSSSIA